jgi:DNA repair exonuclease SbcCD ATPase subunit
MDRLILIIVMFLSVLAVDTFAAEAITPAAPDTTKDTANAPAATPPPVAAPKTDISMRQLLNAETYRYGREMYLRGNYPEAARVFLKMLSLECGNRIARYHLQEIAQKSPDLAFLTEKLKQLPCKADDGPMDEMLSAKLYYEKDPDLLLEQLISDRNNHRLTEEELNAKVTRYTKMISELESAVNTLKAVRPSSDASPAPRQDLVDQVEASRKAADLIAKEISALTNRMASERINGQKELQDLRTQLAEAEAGLAADNTGAPEKPAATEYSAKAKELLKAIEDAKNALSSKEEIIQQKNTALETLQARFDDIQLRLKVIQRDLLNKNLQIRAIQTNLQDIQKPSSL